MAGRTVTEGYTAKQVTAITGVSYQTLNHWARTGLVEPSIAQAAGSGSERIYSFRDLIALKLAGELRKNGVSLVLRIAGIDPLGRKAQEEILPHAQAGFFEHGQQQLYGSAGIGGRFQDDEHSGMEMLDDFLAGGHDVAHIRVFGLAQGRGHADVDGVQVAHRAEIGGRAQLALLDELG